MNSASAPAPETPPELTAGPAATPSVPSRAPPGLLAVIGVALGVLASGASALLWQKLSNVQEQLARQSAESGRVSTEAQVLAREARELARETAARVAVFETRLSEVSLQRSQLEELMQSLSRSRDENLVVDIESAIRLAQQQAQLAGSVEPLLAALRTAEQRVVRAAQPRLVPLQRAITRDLARVKAATVTDTASLLTRLDELTRIADELPLANAVAVTGASAMPAKLPAAGASSPAVPVPSGANRVLGWVTAGWGAVLDEARKLVRVSRIAQPEAALLSPEQSFFVRENLKLKLLNARLGLLARQMDSARGDINAAAGLINRYFDASARRTQTATALLQQVQQQMKTLELPRVDDTLTALTTAASGR